ncbi:twin-arginine translocation signal domain-containing protein [Streptomyces sp. NPDC006296]
MTSRRWFVRRCSSGACAAFPGPGRRPNG